MHCELCGKEPQTFVLMPIRGKRGALETIGCMPCAISRGVYCEKHDRPHLGFEDGTHACVVCIEHDVIANYGWVVELEDRIQQDFSEREQVEVEEYLESVSFLPDRGRNLLRPIATLARRGGKPFREMFELVLRGRSAVAFTEGKIPVQEVN